MKCNHNTNLHDHLRIPAATSDSNVFALEAVLKSHPSAGKLHYDCTTSNPTRSIKKPDEPL